MCAPYLLSPTMKRNRYHNLILFYIIGYTIKYNIKWIHYMLMGHHKKEWNNLKYVTKVENILT